MKSTSTSRPTAAIAKAAKTAPAKVAKLDPKAIAKSTNVPALAEERKKQRSIAKVFETLYGKRGDAYEEQANATENALRCERRLGEICEANVPHTGGRPKKNPDTMSGFSLRELGVSEKQSSRWQALARVPENDFEEYVAETRSKLARLTVAGVMSKARREERNEKLATIARGNAPIDAVAERFPIIYGDPPWRYEHVASESRAIENQYPTMALEEICDLKIGDAIATDDAVLFLWATAPKLLEAMRVIEAWGFTYRTNIVWDKEAIGMGYWARIQHELLLIATRGEPPAPPPEARFPSVVRVKRSKKHSQKPELFAERIEQMFPTLPRVELFARAPRAGWTAWGNQSGGAA